MNKDEKKQGKSSKNLLLAHPPRASKITLANIVFAQVHEQGMRRNKENLRKISSERIRAARLKQLQLISSLLRSMNKDEKDQENMRKVSLANPCRARKTTLANIVFAQVHEQG
jgi:hypothetical protein